MKVLKIRDAHAIINGDKTEFEFNSCGIDIISDDGRTWLGIHLNAEMEIEISGGQFCKLGDKMFDETLCVIPRATNMIKILRKEYTK